MPCTCAVLECTNNERQKKLRKGMLLFHRFPVKSADICRQWMEKCGRNEETTKPENSRVCSDHFKEDDYQVDLRNRLLGCPERRILKTTAVPSVFPGRSEESPNVENKEEEEKGRERFRGEVGKEIERIIAENEAIRQAMPVQLFAAKRFAAKEDVATLKNIVAKQRKEILRLHGIINALKSKAAQQKTASYVKRESTLKKNLKTIFSKTQIRRISGKKLKKVNWTKEDVEKALTMHDVSAKAYAIALNAWKLPLPAIRTLRTWSRSFRGESNCFERREEETEPSSP